MKNADEANNDDLDIITNIVKENVKRSNDDPELLDLSNLLYLYQKKKDILKDLNQEIYLEFKTNIIETLKSKMFMMPQNEFIKQTAPVLHQSTFKTPKPKQ